MNNKLNFLVALALITSLVFLQGCTEEPKADVKAEFESSIFNSGSKIGSGETTKLLVKAENTGKMPITGYFAFATDAPDKVNIKQVGGQSNFEISPGEDTGNRIFEITGISESIEQKFEITVYFIQNGTDKIAGKDTKILTVNK